MVEISPLNFNHSNTKILLTSEEFSSFNRAHRLGLVKPQLMIYYGLDKRQSFFRLALVFVEVAPRAVKERIAIFDDAEKLLEVFVFVGQRLGANRKVCNLSLQLGKLDRSRPPVS